HRAGDDAVQAADDKTPLGHQEHALPVIFQHLAGRRREPAKPAALDDRALGRLAQIVEIAAGILREAADRDPPGRSADAAALAHGRHSRKLAISRSPAIWLFSG